MSLTRYDCMGACDVPKEVVMGRNRAGGANELPLGRLARMAITRQFVNAYRATTTDRYLVARIQECIDDL